MAESKPATRGGPTTERARWALADAMERFLDAVLWAAGLLVAEGLVVGLLAWSQLAGGYELALTLSSLLPLAVVGAAPLALGAACWLMGLDHAHQRRGRLAVTIPNTLVAALVAYGVSGGRLLEGARRPLFVGVVVLAVAAASWWGTVPLARGLARLRAGGKIWSIGAVAVACTVLELANAWILPRLYPAMHLGLALATLWVAALAASGWRLGEARAARVAISLAVSVVALLLSLGAAARLSLYDNIRLVYLERAPLLGHAIRLAAEIEPPPPIEEGALTAAPSGTGRSLELGQRDLLLVTIDALRADHVGHLGYSRPVTPELDALASEGASFEAAYTATPHTSYAVTSLMTGKYMRPLLRQGVGRDSETWAAAMRRYGYHTAAFYPPAIFFIDPELFGPFADSGLGFEYRKVQFSAAAARAEELRAFLSDLPDDRPLFVWVHLFEPHEPYEAHADHPFGDRAIDRYDSEVAAADRGLGEVVRVMRAARPHTVVVVSSDHGEEFGDHGGRYHGTTVYEEQVRVPLVLNAPGLIHPKRVRQPVGLVDVLPTVLRGLRIPVSPRIRGRDLGPLLTGEEQGEGFAFAETDEHTLLARGPLRLVCARRIGACRLYDVLTDPGEIEDVSAAHVQALAEMKRQLTGFVASLGRFEAGQGDGATGWPRALRRGIAGDVEAAVDVAGLLDDASVKIRRKAAEVLFELGRGEVAPQLRRALRRDEDDLVRRWCALALTRLGQGAPLVFDMLSDADRGWRRLAALALAEAGDDRGESILLGWWRAAYPEKEGEDREIIAFERARQLAAGLGRIKSRAAVGPLTWGLRDVRLRPYVAEALAAIGEEAARPALSKALIHEPYQDARVAMAGALVRLGAGAELRAPLVRFLGAPDPLEGGLGIALQADILRFVGGPRDSELGRLRRFATSGVTVGIAIPESEFASGKGLRVLVRARVTDQIAGEVRFGLSSRGVMSDGDRSQPVPKRAPSFEEAYTATLHFDPSADLVERHALLPPAVAERVSPGDLADFVVYATQNLEIEAVAVVPLCVEVPAPEPLPWKPDRPQDGGGQGGAGGD